MVAVKSLVILAAIANVGDVELLCFGSKWCGPCRLMEPTIERLQSVGYPVRKIDIDQQQELANQFRVHSVPCFILLRDGKPVDRIDGATSFDQLARLFPSQQAAQPLVRGQSPSRVGGLSSAVLGALSFDRGTRGESPGSRPLKDSGSAAPNTSPGTVESSRSQAMAATVRLRVDDDTGHSYGTGTVIDVHGTEALVLTCSHIFDSSKGTGPIAAEVFHGQNPEVASGKLISRDDKLDVALVSIGTRRPLRPVTVAGTNYRAKVGESVFSIGCNHGEDPTIVEGHVKAIDRYLGPSNLVVSGRPVDGRSGGGLFAADGRLIGVCNAADPQIDEGLYAALPRIYQELGRNGLAFVYQRSAKAAGDLAPAGRGNLAGAAGPVQSAAPRALASSAALASAIGSKPDAAMVGDHQKEVICIVRSRDADGPGRVFVIDRPSRELVERLTLEHERQANRDIAAPARF